MQYCPVWSGPTQMFLLVFGFVILFECSMTLNLLELHVPQHVPLGTRASLSCRWQLGPADVLYSVKWYKDGKEFFRHVPRDVEPRRKFPLPGVDVEEFDTFGSQIMLAPAALETEGRYRCEVSGEGPLFLTVSEHADIFVVVLPRHGPVLTGLRDKYHPSERLVVNCTSGQSRPKTHLAWYLNEEPLPDFKPTHQNKSGLVTTCIILDFKVDVIHFKNNVLKVKCLATISPIYWRSNEASAILDRNRAYEHLDKRNTIIMDANKFQANSACIANATDILNLFSGLYSLVVIKKYVFGLYK